LVVFYFSIFLFAGSIVLKLHLACSFCIAMVSFSGMFFYVGHSVLLNVCSAFVIK